MTDYPGQGLPPPESGGPPPYGPPPGQPPYGQSPGPPPPGQPPPGQPPYGPPPGPPGPGGFGPYGPPPGGRSKLPWAIGGGVVVAAAVVLILVFALGGESGSSKKDSPERAVGTYANAAVHNDRDTAKKVSCAADQSSFDDDSSGAPDVKSYKVGDAKVDGDHATVPITVVNKEGKSEDEVVPVHKEKGTWLVCFSDQGTSGGEGNSSGAGAASASAIPSGVLPSGMPSGTFCVTPDGATPICASN